MNSLKSRERGFTLIELLIVTVVIVTLMGIVFRLAGVGGDSRARSKTIARLQRLENAISGYYAAYGSYPPVPLQWRSRDINRRVNKVTGVQCEGTEPVDLNTKPDEGKEDGKRIVRQIDVACRAQPVAALYPFFMADNIDSSLANDVKKNMNDFVNVKKWKDIDNGELENVGGLNLGDPGEPPLFQFGLLSFLLPRYLFMLGGDPAMYDTPRGAWWSNNQLPSQIDSGIPYGTWKSMQEALYKPANSGDEAWKVRNLASQAVCARWMPNFEGIVSGGKTFYGVSTAEPEWPYLGGDIYTGIPGWHTHLRKFSRPGKDGKYSDASSSPQNYLLDGMTVLDGWGNEFYYYAEPPFQSYRLWSAGANRRTFPPWLDIATFNEKEQETITGWTKDDISHLAN